MKSTSLKKAATLGDFIAQVHDEFGERKASGIVRLACKARLLEFRGPHPATV